MQAFLFDFLAHSSQDFFYYSTAPTQKAVVDAYSLSVQGFFVKQNSMAELEKTITVIMEYWKRCVAPKNFLNLFKLFEVTHNLNISMDKPRKTRTFFGSVLPSNTQ